MTVITERLLKLSAADLTSYLPHRGEWALLEQLEVKSNKNAVGLVNLSVNKWFFNGHFPNQPIMPGVIIIEAMAQSAGALFSFNNEHSKGVSGGGSDHVNKSCNQSNKIGFLVGVDNAKFRKPITPDLDSFECDVSLVKSAFGIYKFDCRVVKNGITYAQAIIKLALTG